MYTIQNLNETGSLCYVQKEENKMKANQQIQRGRVKRTNGQVKKHVKQMSGSEIQFLARRLKLVSGSYKFSSHFLKSERLFNMLTIERLLNSPDIKDCIIEYNETPSSKKGVVGKRVLLRSTFSRKVLLEKKGKELLTEANLCMVIDIYTGEIVTAYWNEAGDNHHNIDMRRYNEQLTICA